MKSCGNMNKCLQQIHEKQHVKRHLYIDYNPAEPVCLYLTDHMGTWQQQRSMYLKKRILVIFKSILPIAYYF